MGTRLYPDVSNDVMERLVKVPEGTWARLEEFEKTRPNDFSEEIEAWYDTLVSDTELSTLYNFKLYGWGKLYTETCQYISEHGMDSACGETKDSVHVATILNLQGIETAEKISSLSWN